MQYATVLLIAQDLSLRDAVRDTIAAKPSFHLMEAADFASARMCVAQNDVVVILAHLRTASECQALEALVGTSAAPPRVVVIHDSLPAAQVLSLLQRGTVECLERPLNISRLALVLDMLAAPALVSANTMPAPGQEPPDPGAPLAASPSMQQLVQQLRLVAPLDTTVLITGETGTGKTRLSRWIHELSDRQSRRFVTVHCGALSATLIESELFGHVRGAFTGADRDHAGKFSQCQDGTLLLDEIDTLSLEMQVKLLRVVEERLFEPVGSEHSQQLKARLIVATNRPLEQEVASGRFRADLYYRLNVVAFHLPPLRQRTDEIHRLVQHFLTDFARQHRLPRPALAPAASRALELYHWPGNIRQLRNVVERAVILSAGSVIDTAVLPEAIGQLAASDSEPAKGRDISTGGNKLASARLAAEHRQLLDALRRNGNNRSRTALDLGISRVALYKQLRKFQMV